MVSWYMPCIIICTKFHCSTRDDAIFCDPTIWVSRWWFCSKSKDFIRCSSIVDDLFLCFLSFAWWLPRASKTSYTLVNEHSNGIWTHCRCISYWKILKIGIFQPAMLVYQRVFLTDLLQQKTYHRPPEHSRTASHFGLSCPFPGCSTRLKTRSFRGVFPPYPFWFGHTVGWWNCCDPGGFWGGFPEYRLDWVAGVFFFNEEKS